MNLLHYWEIQRQLKFNHPPLFVRHYYEALLADAPANRIPVEKVRFVVLDTETTGIDHRADTAISIGAIALRHCAIVVRDALDLVIQTAAAVPLQAAPTTVHGLIMEDLNAGVTQAEAAEAVLAYLKTDVMVAHHAAFDQLMVEKTVRTVFPPFKLFNPILDTAFLMRRIDQHDQPNLKNRHYNLDELAERFAIEMNDRHTALGDAFITAQLFLCQLAILRARGVRTLADLARMPIERHSI